MKKRLNYLPLLFLSILLFLCACRKDPPRTIIQGRITEYGTDKPIEGARIYVLCDGSTIFGPSGSSLSDSILTDTDGNFYREYQPTDLCGSVYLLPYKKGYFKGNELDITTDNKFFNITLDPEAWLKVVTVPDGGIKHLFIRGDFYGGAGYDAYASDGIQEEIFLTTGNRYTQIRWRSYESSSQMQYDSLYLSAHDTTTYTIHY